MTASPASAPRRALVTGASRGIGAAIARRLADDGCTVVVNYRESESAARSVVADIESRGGTAHAVGADMADRKAATGLVDKAADLMGGLDILVCNAGIGNATPLLDTTPEDYDALFDIARGTFFALQRAGQLIDDGGRIIAVSTLGTRQAAAAPAYCASKIAIEQFCKGLAHEIAMRGITVNAVLPGFTKTGMLADLPEDYRKMMVDNTSMGRLGQPEDIAALVGFLAGADAGWITGEAISANGGART